MSARVMCVGGGGQRDARHAGEALVQDRQAEVFLAEVVAPLADAMRLVDGEQAEQAALVQRIEHGQEARRQRCARARRRAAPGGPSSSSRSMRCASSPVSVELRNAACTPASSSAPTWSCISAISGLTTTRHAAAGAVAHDGRHLVAQALAAAGGHQHQRVAAADDMVHDLGLQAAKGAVAEDLVQHLLGAGSGCGGGLDHGRWRW